MLTCHQSSLVFYFNNITKTFKYSKEWNKTSYGSDLYLLHTGLLLALSLLVSTEATKFEYVSGKFLYQKEEGLLGQLSLCWNQPSILTSNQKLGKQVTQKSGHMKMVSVLLLFSLNNTNTNQYKPVVFHVHKVHTVMAYAMFITTHKRYIYI